MDAVVVIVVPVADVAVVVVVADVDAVGVVLRTVVKPRDYNFSLYNGPSEEAPGRTCCDTGQMAKTARIELNKTGIDLDAFDHKIYAWPVNPHLHSPLIHLTRGR